MQHSRRECRNKKQTLDSQYDELVSEIRKLRLSNKKVDRKIEKLEKLKTQKKRMKQIAFAQGLTDYKETYGVPLLDLLHTLIESAKITREIVGENNLKFLLNLFTTLYNIYKNPEWDVLIVNMTNFFVNHFPQKHADLAMVWFKSAFEVAFPQDDKTSWRSYILSIFESLGSVLGDQIWEKISDFFTKLFILYGATEEFISFDTLDVMTAMSKMKEFQKSIPQAQDLVEMCFNAYEFVTGNWEHIVKGNWSELCLGKNETQEFEVEVRLLEQAFDLVMRKREIELKDKLNLTEKEFETRLNQCIKTAKSLVVRCTSRQQKMAVSNFVKTLTQKQASYWATKSDTPTKEEAYSVKFSGGSSCGKSTLMNMVSKTILYAYGHDPNEQGLVVSTNIEESYESSVLPMHKIIGCDDVANNINRKPNYDRLLNYKNTIPRPLEKAGVEEKGTMFPMNDALLVTTNDETLRAVECSVCPESILRRFDLDVEVRIRSEYQNAFGGLMKLEAMNWSVYEFVLKRFSYIDKEGDPEQKRPPGKIVWDYIPRKEWNPYDDMEHDLSALCRFIAQDVIKHKKAQKSKMQSQSDIESQGFCPECKVPGVLCACGKSEAIAMAGFGTLWSGMSTSELWDTRVALHSVSSLYRKTLLAQKLWHDRTTIRNILMGFISCVCVGSLIGPTFAQCMLFSVVAFSLLKYQKMLQEIDEEISKRSDQLSSLCVDLRTHLETNARKYFAGAAAIFTAYKVYKAVRPLLKSQDKTSFREDCLKIFPRVLDCPKKGQFVFEMQDERDYKEGYSRLTPKETAISKTTTSADLQRAIAKALRVVYIKSAGQMLGTVNGIMVASNVLLVPAHIIPYVFPFDVETTTVPGVPSASTKDQKLTAEYCYIDRAVDQAYIHLASSPASSNFAQFYPEEYPEFYGRDTTLLWKSPENETKISRQVCRPTSEDLQYAGLLEHPGMLWGSRHKITTLTLRKGKGIRYETEFKGFGGLCGAPVIDSQKGIIYGFHVAGYSNSYQGYSTCVIQSQIKTALNALKQTSPTLVVHSAGEIKVDTYGLPYTIVNEKPNYTREDGTKDKTVVTYYGKVLKDGQPMESRARPPYIPTPFEGIVEEFGESKHRPPTKVNDVAKGMKTLNKLTDPVQHYEGDLLIKAINDYKTHTLKAVRENMDDAKDMLRIYSQEEAMDGIGEFGLGGLPNDTSAGFPIQKSKKHCLVRDIMDESLVQVPRQFNENFDIQSEIDRTLECWSNGKRSETIYKASSKVNELLPNAKAVEKVRKFYGSSFANFVASRRVLAGVPRFMRKYWRSTECLVGINATSKEWDEFHEYLTAYSTKNMIAGDFSGFDTRMAAQITSAAANVMISWYQEVGCDEDEIELLRGALSDIVHPNILFDGDLYKFANGNPSGNLITVQLNSICNSIMMRYVYYSMMPHIREPFASNVRLGTYGDDNAMSVKHHCKWYTHTSCQAEFAKLDIGYTMAEKTAESLPYIPIDQISFLKRNFVVHETLGKIVAPIEIDSILKKFYYVKKPNETPLSVGEQFGAYTDGAFREAYLHGRNYYEKFQQSMRNIVTKNPDLKYTVDFIPYEEMTKILKPYYMEEYVNDNKKLFAESIGVEDVVFDEEEDDSGGESA